MEREDALPAIRRTVALSSLSHVIPLRLSGEGAFDALDRLCTAELYLRDGQMLHTLLLDEEARPFADLYAGRDDEAFVLLAEGPSKEVLLDHLRAHLPKDAGVTIEDLGAEHELLSLDGPWAWELMSELVGPEVVGLPYNNFFRPSDLIEGGLCFRAGKTGEFGYHLLVPRGEVAGVRARIEEAGRAFELGTADLDELDRCALENWFFNIRREGRAGVTPLELQLQWRVSRRKAFVGSEALAARWSAGMKERLTAFTSEAAVAVGDRVLFEGEAIGRVVNAAASVARGGHVGLALLDVHLAYPGIDRFSVEDRCPIRTVSPPFLDNRSLHVNPQEHSFRDRAALKFPPIG